MEISEIRRRSLKLLIKKHGGPTALAKKLAHRGTSYMSQLSTGRRDIGEKVARQIERQLHLPALWMDGTGGKPDTAVPIGLDMALFKETLKRVAEQLQKDDLKLSPAKFADVFAYVYQEAAKGQTVDVAAVLKLVS